MMQYMISYAVIYVDDTSYTGICHVNATSETSAVAIFWRTGGAFVGEPDEEIAEIKTIKLIKITASLRRRESGVLESMPEEAAATA